MEWINLLNFLICLMNVLSIFVRLKLDMHNLSACFSVASLIPAIIGLIIVIKDYKENK